MSNINTPDDIDLINDRMIDMKTIVAFTGLSTQWFYKLMDNGLFPKPIKQGRSSRWLESEVKAWLLARIKESRGN